MLKRYLVVHEDSAEWDPAFVHALTAGAAVEQYMKQIYSKDPVLRERVLDLRHFESFVCGLVYTTLEEKEKFIDGDRAPSHEFLRSRVMDFFGESPVLGERFLNYVATQDPNTLDDDVYKYIAVRDTDGIVAIAESAIRVL